MIGYFKKVGGAILDFLFPIYCVGCKKEKTHCCEKCALKIERNPELEYCHPELEYCHPELEYCHPELVEGCASCEKNDTTIDWLFSAAIFHEKSLLATLIHRYKYDGAQELAEFFASLLPENLPELIFHKCLKDICHRKPIILVPVPLHWLRFNFRGFNQSELFAHALAKKFTGEVAPTLRRGINGLASPRLGLFEVKNLLKRTRNTKPQAQLKREERLKNVVSAFSLKNPDEKLAQGDIFSRICGLVAQHFLKTVLGKQSEPHAASVPLTACGEGGCAPLFEGNAVQPQPQQIREKLSVDAIYIIVDDVFTTGSTMNECAKTLKLNGAREVFGLTIAKAV